MRPKKRPWRASGVGCERGSADLAFEIEDDALEVVLVEDLLVLGSAEEEGTATEVVDLASDALGVVVDAGEEAVAEELALAAGDAEMVLDVAGGLLQVEGFEVEADGDALVEGLVGSEAELVGQVGLAEEDEGDQGSGIHLVVEQEAQLVEELRGQEVGFVDDEQDVAALAGQVVEGGAELREEAHKAEGRLDLEGEEDLAVEGGDAQVGIGEIDDGVEVAVEGLGEGADGGGFAGADVAGDESGETLLEGKGEAALDLAVAAGRDRGSGGDGLGERGGGEAVKVIEAVIVVRSPCRWVVRAGRSECPRVAPGAGALARRAGGPGSRGRCLAVEWGRDRVRRLGGWW